MLEVYVLKSKKYEYYYIGSTNDISRRVKEHNSGASSATRPYKPFENIARIRFSNQHRAIGFERYLKSGSGKAFLKKHFL